MKLLKSEDWNEDLGDVVFVSFSRDASGNILGEPPELYFGSGSDDYLDLERWTHFIDGDFNFIFSDADPVRFPTIEDKQCSKKT